MNPDPARVALPDRRHSWTQKVHVGGQTLYLTCGEYDDGRLGEIFLDLGQASTPMRAMLANFAKAVSINLQYGVPLEAVLHGLRGQDFPPQGPVDGSAEVRQCRSIVDYVCRQLEAAYLEPKGEAGKAAGAVTRGSGV
jgi:ribonucleoside-diphosphate reductase alpha chain